MTSRQRATGVVSWLSLVMLGVGLGVVLVPQDAAAAPGWVLDRTKTKLLEGDGEKGIWWDGAEIGKHRWSGNGYTFTYSGIFREKTIASGTLTMTPPPTVIRPGQQIRATWTATMQGTGEANWGAAIAVNWANSRLDGDDTISAVAGGGTAPRAQTHTGSLTGKLPEGTPGDEWVLGAKVGVAQDNCPAMYISLYYKYVADAQEEPAPTAEKPRPKEVRAVPAFAGPGSMLEVDLEADVPLTDAKADFGPGITQYGEPTEKGKALNCRIRIAPDAALGEREVKLTFPDGATSKAVFTVHPLVVVIDIDGLRPDVFEAAVRGGQAESWWERLKGNATRPPVPQLSRLMGKPLQSVGGPPRCLEFEHGLLVQDAITTFPSYTFPAQASFVTGVEPGVHGIPGNAIFDRATQTNFGFDGAEKPTFFGSQAMGVYSEGLAAKQLQAPTIYEQLPVAPLVVWHQFTTGVSDDRWKRADLLDQVLYLRPSTTQAYDRNATEELLKVVQRLAPTDEQPASAGKLPGLIWLYLTTVDHYGHLKDDDMVARQIRHYCDYVDSNLQAVFDFFERYPGTIFLVVSDHGQTDIRAAQDIGWDKWKRVLGANYTMWTPGANEARCDTVVRLNSGLAHVYLNAVSAADEPDCGKSWPQAPAFDRVVELGDRIAQWDHLGIVGLPAGPYWDLILVRNAERDGWNGPYQVLIPSTLDEPRPRTEPLASYLRRTNNAFGVRLGWQNTPDDIAFITERINSLSCQRAGDIVVLPHYVPPQPLRREGENYYHFTGDSYTGQHGSFSTDDMRMTFAIAQLKRENSSGLLEILRGAMANPARPRILDVSSTVAALCGERFRGRLHVAQQGAGAGTTWTPTATATPPATTPTSQPAPLPPADVTVLARLAGKVIITADASRQAVAVAAEAAKLMAVGEFARAEALWLKALQLDPNSVTAWLGLGRNYSEDDKNAEAVRATRVAVQLKPNDHGTHHALALALLLDGKREEAVKEARRAKELGDPEWELLTAMIEAEE